MSETFTPGPWEADTEAGPYRGTSDEQWYVYASSAPKGKRAPAVADSRANARLIAESPAMLDLLGEVVWPTKELYRRYNALMNRIDNE